MVERKGIVNNVFGIHCRPADAIRRSVEGYPGKIEVIGPDGRSANPHRLLSLLSLALTNGDAVTVRVDGPDEEGMCEKVLQLFQASFDFQK